MITSYIDPNNNYSIHPKLLAVDAMNVLLRGEISAVEAYKQVIEKLSSDPEHQRLLEFLNWHEKNVSYWKEQVKSELMMSSETSGLWGYVVEAFVGSAKLLGNSSALKALKKGEGHGLNEYENLLENEFIAPEHKKYVREEVIPELKLHISSIEAMSKMQ